MVIIIKKMYIGDYSLFSKYVFQKILACFLVVTAFVCVFMFFTIRLFVMLQRVSTFFKLVISCIVMKKGSLFWMP